MIVVALAEVAVVTGAALREVAVAAAADTSSPALALCAVLPPAGSPERVLVLVPH